MIKYSQNEQSKDKRRYLQRSLAQKELTQVELAKKASIHPNTIAKIEREEQNPEFATIKKIARVLDLDLSKLPN